MNNTKRDKKYTIYELMIGALDTENYYFPENEFVKNEFAEGERCYELYSQVFDAKCRLNKRLGTDEDHDVELIIDCLLEISRELAMKMYDYGKAN